MSLCRIVANCAQTHSHIQNHSEQQPIYVCWSKCVCKCKIHILLLLFSQLRRNQFQFISNYIEIYRISTHHVCYVNDFDLYCIYILMLFIMMYTKYHILYTCAHSVRQMTQKLLWLNKMAIKHSLKHVFQIYIYLWSGVLARITTKQNKTICAQESWTVLFNIIV